MGLVLGEKEGGREGEAKGGKGQEESEERVGRVLREGKKCGEGEFGAHYSPALQRRSVHISGRRVFYLSRYFRADPKVLPGTHADRIAPRSEVE